MHTQQPESTAPTRGYLTRGTLITFPATGNPPVLPYYVRAIFRNTLPRVQGVGRLGLKEELLGIYFRSIMTEWREYQIRRCLLVLHSTPVHAQRMTCCVMLQLLAVQAILQEKPLAHRCIGVPQYVHTGKGMPMCLPASSLKPPGTPVEACLTYSLNDLFINW